jgi:hypothetical protein
LLAKNKDRAVSKEFKIIMDKLSKGLIIQDASSNLMTFLVQDFLDYAQIKAGKFRVNCKPFNIRHAVEMVMNF